MIPSRSRRKSRKSLTAFCAILGPVVVWLMLGAIQASWNQSRGELWTDRSAGREDL